MKKLWKFLIAAVAILFAVLAIGLVGLFYKQKEITQWAITEANKNFEGHLQVADSQVSIFHDFPYLDLDLKGVRFFATKDTTTQPLYEIKDLYLGFRWLDLVQSNFDVQLIDVKGGHVDVVQYANGDINILMAKKISRDTTMSNSSDNEFQVHLKKLMMEDFNISFARQIDSTEYRSHLRKVQLSFKAKKGHLELKTNTSWFLHFSKPDNQRSSTIRM